MMPENVGTHLTAVRYIKSCFAACLRVIFNQMGQVGIVMTEHTVNILLVEDNPGDAVLLKRMLREAGHTEFNLVQTGFLREAAQLLNTQHFDLVLLDLFLPDCYGLDGLNVLAKANSGVPIVVLTGLADEDLATQAVRQGAQDYLVKGQVDKNLLVRALRYAIERKQVETKLLSYQRQLRSLVSRLANTEEQERRRIGDDLHEHIGQVLAMAKIKLGALQQTASDSFVSDAMKEVRDLIAEAIDYTRSLTYELTSPVLYELGFESAVEAYADRFGDRYSIKVEYVDDRLEKPLDDGVRMILFQAIRELLINAAKHSQANVITVSLQRIASDIRVEVADNGVGFDIHGLQVDDNKKDGFGLFNIRDRLDHIGGECSIYSEVGKGTRVTLKAPLKLFKETEKGMTK